MNEALANGADFMTYDGGSGAGKYAATMFFLISIPPAVGMLLSAIPTSKYAMSDKEHTRILSELVERRTASKEEKTDDIIDDNTKALQDNMEQIVDEINKLD
jgi:hypothetical protein